MSTVAMPSQFALGGREIQGNWWFDAADPVAVTLTVGGRDWEFARQLLSSCLLRPFGAVSGADDIQFRVTSDGLLRIALSSPTGRAELTCPAAEVRVFLGHTLLLCKPCPSGACSDLMCAECAAVRVLADEVLVSLGLSDRGAAGDVR